MRVGMFLGVETFSWSVDLMKQTATQLKNEGVDTIFLKVADGAIEWYGDYIGVCNTLKPIINVIPYQYCYGNKYGALVQELAITNKLLQAGFTPCLDMEVEYNGQTEWCTQLANGLTGQVHVSTWADPGLQNWNACLSILNPKVHLFFPQVYTTYLKGVWKQQYQAAGIDLTKCIPTITPETIDVATGLDAVTMWEYQNFTGQELQTVEGDLIKVVTVSMNSNENQKKQATDIWNANTVGAQAGTGIYAVWINQFMEENRNLGIPISKEIHTVDYAGVAIVKQFFGMGINIDWYTQNGDGHKIGENHGYANGVKLW